MSMRILTVDDSRMMREMLLMALRGAGFDVIQAEDGEHGIEVLAANGADVIITDINMPNLNGFDLFQAIKTDERLQQLPVLMMTAQTHEGYATRAIQSGTAGYIVKPFTQAELEEKVQEILGRPLSSD